MEDGCLESHQDLQGLWCVRSKLCCAEPWSGEGREDSTGTQVALSPLVIFPSV